jgi:hypothetical protein
MPPRTNWWAKPKASTRTAKKATKAKATKTKTSKQKAAPKTPKRQPGEGIYRYGPEAKATRKAKAQKPLSLGEEIMRQQDAKDRAYYGSRGFDPGPPRRGDTWTGGPMSRRTSKEGRA